MSRIVPKCGYNRNTKKEILYGPLQYGGANFRHLFDQQGLGQLTLFLRNWRQQTVAGQLLKSVVSWAQFTTGMAFPILEDPSTPLPHLESKWLTSLRGYLASINAALHLDVTGLPPLEREHDAYIMDVIVRSRQFTDNEIIRLNYCRLFLNALTLSDLSDTTGNHLDQGKLTGEPSIFSSRSKWMAVNQDRPSEHEWRLWNKANRLWSSEDGKLQQPLGDWLQDTTTRRIRHFAYRDCHCYLFIRTQYGYIKCRSIRSNRFRETGRLVTQDNIPNRAQPAEVKMVQQEVWAIIHTTGLSPLVETRQRAAGTFEEYLSTLEAWEYDLLRHSTLFADAFTICEVLQTAFLAGSDGSEKFGTDGAFGWMISSESGERAAAGMGPSRGWRMDSYRAECSGMLSILRFLFRLGEFTFRAESWKGTIGTDSQSMLQKLFGRTKVREGDPLTADMLVELDVMIAEWDLLCEIQESLRMLPDVKLTYVKGHQDSHRAYSRLSLLAQLNVDAGDKAAEYQRHFGKAHPFVLMSTNAGAFVTLPEGTSTSKVIPELRNYATTPPLRQYIQVRNHWTDHTMDTINWRAHGKALNGMIKNRVHLTKLVHESLPTFQRLNKMTRTERKCPACSGAEESRDHILRCPNTERGRWRVTFMAKMEKFHDKENTSPLLRNVWREAMELWFANETQDIQVAPFLFPQDVRQVIIQQNAIGWRQIFNGRFAKAWASVQADFLARREMQGNDRTSARHAKKGKQWQQRFIQEIWQQWLILWKQRNELVHGKALPTQREAKRRQTETELRAIYDTRDTLEPKVKSLLYNEVEDHLQRHKPHATRNWIQTNAPIFRESLRRAKRRAISGVRSIRSYFAPVR